MEKEKFKVPTHELGALCKQWGIAKLELFGSALNGDFSEKSDVDLLVVFHENSVPAFFEFMKMKTELEKLFGRSVDVMTRRSIEKSHNQFRKKEILSSVKTLYEEAA